MTFLGLLHGHVMLVSIVLPQFFVGKVFYAISVTSFREEFVASGSSLGGELWMVILL